MTTPCLWFERDAGKIGGRKPVDGGRSTVASHSVPPRGCAFPPFPKLAPDSAAASFVSMPAAPAQADARQTEIYRRMTPPQRLELAMQMNRRMRELMDSGLQATHPHLDAEARRREIARRIRHARG